MTSELHAAATFIAPRQLRPETHMAMVGQGEETIANDLQEFDTKLFIEREGSEVAAVVGYEHDAVLQRGFLYGPWAIDQRRDELADELFDRVLAETGGDRDIELAFNVRNKRARGFSDRHGFELVGDHFFMGYPRKGANVSADDAIQPMAADDRDAMMALHERCFPGVWPSGKQLLEQLDKGPDRTIFVLREGDRIAGYHYARVDRSTGEASVENIGVDEAFRGRGLATRLLSHGLWWMFSFEEVTGIELSVRAENVAAIRVYEKAGFRKRHSIRQTRKPLRSVTPLHNM